MLHYPAAVALLPIPDGLTTVVALYVAVAVSLAPAWVILALFLHPATARRPALAASAIAKAASAPVAPAAAWLMVTIPGLYALEPGSPAGLALVWIDHVATPAGLVALLAILASQFACSVAAEWVILRRLGFGPRGLAVAVARANLYVLVIVLVVLAVVALHSGGRAFPLPSPGTSNGRAAGHST